MFPVAALGVLRSVRGALRLLSKASSTSCGGVQLVSHEDWATSTGKGGVAPFAEPEDEAQPVTTLRATTTNDEAMLRRRMVKSSR